MLELVYVKNVFLSLPYSQLGNIMGVVIYYEEFKNHEWILFD